jgi:hypothetical protein
MPATEVIASPTPQPTLASLFDDTAQFRAAMRPEFADDVTQFPDATRYVIDVAVAFEADGTATLTGRERIRYTNQQDFALDEVVLMLWPNHREQYLSDMVLQGVWLNDGLVAPEMELRDLVARITLPAPLEPGQSVELSTAFTAEAFPGIDESGAARFGLTYGVLLAPTFYPLIPRIVDGEWQAVPAASGGDTTNSDTALYTWRVTAPADLAIVATGTVVEATQAGDTQTQTLVTGPMRDLALVVGPLEHHQRDVDGVTLNAYVLENHAEFADDLLDYTEEQVRTLQTLVGPYPFNELEVVDAPGAFGGIEYPGVIFIGVVDGSSFFEIATVHEVGHQWFYSLVGDDQLLEPWLDEAAATYTEVLYFENVGAEQAAEELLAQFRTVLQVMERSDLPIGLPVADYDDDYGAIVYLKGALFFDALRRELGDETFFTFLQNYYTAYRYGFATSAGFQAVAEETCACELDDLFDLWVYEGGPVPPPP